MKFIDIHCQLNFKDYDTDREEVIKRAQAEEVGVINVGNDITMSQGVVTLAHKYRDMWAIVGVHPLNCKEPFDIKILETLVQDPKVVAIGECGLDYFRSEPEDIARQREVFIQHIELANKVNKPLMLHVRNGKENTKAYEEAVDLLKKHSKVRANFHFFAGTLEDAKRIMEINGTVSFTGVVTFARNYDEVIKYIPRDRLMSETDAPYVAPIPFRGKRNEPVYVKEVVASLASIRGENAEEFSAQLVDNVRSFFRI